LSKNTIAFVALSNECKSRNISLSFLIKNEPIIIGYVCAFWDSEEYGFLNLSFFASP
jgi:hypothetical protein